MDFAALHVDDAQEVQAPDGAAVHVLVQESRGSMARFSLPPFGIARAVVHNSVEELWYFLSGTGRMWLKADGREEVVTISPGMSVAISPGTAFQFRSDSAEPLRALGVTMPPWPGAHEARATTGPWTPTDLP